MWENTEQRDSFIMYTEQWPALSLLNDTQLADLMRAIFALHGAGCSAPELDLPTQAVFLLMRPRFGANKARYEEICRRNQENGRRGGRPRRAEAADRAELREAESRAGNAAAADDAEKAPSAPGSGPARRGGRNVRSADRATAGGGSRREPVETAAAETPSDASPVEEAGSATPPDIFGAQGGAREMARASGQGVRPSGSLSGEPCAGKTADRPLVDGPAAGPLVDILPEVRVVGNPPADESGRVSAGCEKTDAKPKNRPVFSGNRKTLTDSDPDSDLDTDSERNKNHPLPSCEEGGCAGGDGLNAVKRSGSLPAASADAPACGRERGHGSASVAGAAFARQVPDAGPQGGGGDFPDADPGFEDADTIPASPRTPPEEGLGSGLPAVPPLAAASDPGFEDAADPFADMSVAFHEFLAAYPADHREPVGEAAQVWKKLARRKKLPGLPRLLQGLDAWEDSGQWRKDNGAYIPKAANFLRRTMWLSAPAPARAPADALWDAGAAMERLRAAAQNTISTGGRP